MTKFQTLVKAAADWASEASQMLSAADKQAAALADAAVSQDWPLVVCVTINRCQADLCLVNPDGQMQSLITSGMEQHDARRTN